MKRTPLHRMFHLMFRLAALLSAVLIVYPSCSRQNASNGEEAVGMSADEIIALKHPTEPDLIVDGVPYVKKQNVTAVLFMGIDQKGDNETAGNATAGQCDVLLVLVVDGDSRTQTILQLDRDTLTEVELLDANGNPTGMTREQQICLSHAYGRGDEKSCENTVRAVSRLLNDVPMDGYISILYDAMPALNDLIGGVTVTVKDDFSAVDSSLVIGETVTLMGQQALTYIRGRTSVADGTNENRMTRQRQYLNAFGNTVRGMLKTDSSIVNDLYYTAEPYMVTDLSLSELSSIAVEGAGYTDGGILTTGGVHGKVQSPNGNNYTVFYADEDSILETVLTLFYQPLS